MVRVQSLLLGISAPVLAGLSGTMLGVAAGYFGGWIDRVIGRLIDLLLAFPALLLGILISAALGPGFWQLVATLTIAFAPRFGRIARASTLAIRNEPFIDASILAGVRHWIIIVRHLVPNIAGPIIVVLTLEVASAIRLEATLSFIGLGTQPPAAELGQHHPRRARQHVRFGLAGDRGWPRDHGDDARDQHRWRPRPRHPRPGDAGVTDNLLSIRDLVVEFGPPRAPVVVVDHVDLDLPAKSCLGLVGKSGSGKSVTSLAILRLIPNPPGRISSGRIEFAGRDLLTVPADTMPDIRGRDIGMIFQEPMSSLNPVMPIGAQIEEALFLHETSSRRERRRTGTRSARGRRHSASGATDQRIPKRILRRHAPARDDRHGDCLQSPNC